MTKTQKYPLLAVVGPTASGKSKLAVELAKVLGGEIVSCDSMQVYRRMDIGTAKPDHAQMCGVPHHLLDFIEPSRPFSCADYVRIAEQTIEDICSRGRLPIVCGGTGLYLDRLLCGGSFEETETDENFRRELRAYGEAYGNHALHVKLREVDPESADAIHENNVQRVIRALEIYRTTGIAKSEWDRSTKKSGLNYRAVVIGLHYQSRELLYERINSRVDEMLRRGLLEETKSLLADGIFEINTTAAQAIGYKELIAYLRGKEPYEEAVDKLKQATRRYAKRQMTWFGAKDYVRWMDADRDGVRRSNEALLVEALRLAAEIGG